MISGKQTELYNTARSELDLAEDFQSAGLAYEAGIALARVTHTIIEIRLLGRKEGME